MKTISFHVSPAVGCGWPTAFFCLFFLTKAGIMLYYRHGGNMKNGRLWLAVDSALRKLKNARFWVTSIDPYHKELAEAITNLEVALKKIEEEK